MAWLEVRLVFLCSPGKNVEKGRGEKEGGERERDLRLQFHSYQTNLLEIAVRLRRSRSGRLAEGEAAIPFYAQSGQVIHARG